MSEVLSDRALLALLWEANNNEVLANYPASPLRPVLRSHRALRQQRDALRDSLAFIVECFLQSDSEQVGDCEGRSVTLTMGEIDEMRAALAQCDTQEGVK